MSLPGGGASVERIGAAVGASGGGARAFRDRPAGVSERAPSIIGRSNRASFEAARERRKDQRRVAQRGREIENRGIRGNGGLLRVFHGLCSVVMQGLLF